FRGNLDQLITKLETTKGQVAAVTTAQKEAADVWDRQTGAVSDHTMAAQEHAMAMEGMSKSMFQVDAQATALAKSIDAAVMTEVAANGKFADSTEAMTQKLLDADATTKTHYDNIASGAGPAYDFALQHQDEYTKASLNKLADAANQTNLAAQNWYSESEKALGGVTDAVQQVDGAVQALSGTFETAGTTYADMLSAQQQLTQDWINYALTAPGAVPRGTLGQSFFTNPETGQILPRAAGGHVSAGSAYLVGERGPELFTPGTSGMISPSAGGVVIQPGAFTLNYPIVNDPRALDQLARTVGDAILTKLTRSGARLRPRTIRL